MLKGKHLIEVLETSHLILRKLQEDDAEALFRTVGDPKVMQFWAPGADQMLLHTLERITAINAHWTKYGFGDWAVIEKSQNCLIGFCGLHYIANMNEVNIGYALEKSKWHFGFGTEVVKRLLDFGFDILGLKEIVAVIDPKNTASLKLIQKCGFSYWKESSYMERPRVVYRGLANKSSRLSNL
jgi:ribosomal-protein-alanine N-acetyltransferase